MGNILRKMQKIKEIQRKIDIQQQFDKINQQDLIVVGISEYERNKPRKIIFLNKEGDYIDDAGNKDYEHKFETTFYKVFLSVLGMKVNLAFHYKGKNYLLD